MGGQNRILHSNRFEDSILSGRTPFSYETAIILFFYLQIFVVKFYHAFFLRVYFLGRKIPIAHIGYLKNVLVLLEVFTGSNSNSVSFQTKFRSLVMPEVNMYLFCPYVKFVFNFLLCKFQWAPLNAFSTKNTCFSSINLRSCRKCYSLGVKFLMSLSHIFMTLLISLLK